MITPFQIGNGLISPRSVGGGDAFGQHRERQPHQSESAVYFTVVVTNNGPSDASNVVLSGFVPPQLNFNASSSTPGVTVSANKRVATYTIPSIPAGTTASVTIAAAYTSGGGQTIAVFSVKSTTSTDPDLSNNLADVPVLLQGSLWFNVSNETELRDAIAQVDSNTTGGTPFINIAAVFGITLTQGPLIVSQSVNIEGTLDSSGNAPTIDGGGATRVFEFGGSGARALHAQQPRDLGGNGAGDNAGYGGGIQLFDPDDTLTITNSTITNNTGSREARRVVGSIRTAGSSTHECELHEQRSRLGGGLELVNSSATLTNATFTGNTSTLSGGGIAQLAGSQSTSSLAIVGSSFANNMAPIAPASTT